MEVTVNSREIIKPARPTPAHLRVLELSFLDQITAPLFAPMIYFYSPPPPPAAAADGSTALKTSLSDTLTVFYPLAGRLVGTCHVDCNDEGVQYVEAHAKVPLSHLLAVSDLSLLNCLLPFPHLADASKLPLAVQVTFLGCGGIVIGTCFNHKIADAVSIMYFMKSWAGRAKSGHLSSMKCHGFDLARVFPPRDMPKMKTTSIVNAKKERIVAKRFVFCASALSMLRAKYGNSLIHPTRVEALSAFLWTKILAATQGGGGVPKTHSLLFHMVNLRTRLNPPLPELYFGNVVGYAMVVQPCNSKADVSGFVAQTREATRRIDGQYLGRFLYEHLVSNSTLLSCAKEAAEVLQLTFSSTWRLPVYDADFGWGRPLWVTMAQQAKKNLIFFFPTRLGNGIEALVHLKEDEMARLEADEEFSAFLSSATAQLPSSL
ncbi:Vinorine synthase [Bertholletia excelsa]